MVAPVVLMIGSSCVLDGPILPGTPESRAGAPNKAILIPDTGSQKRRHYF
jgi:hypothetical protein